MAELRMSVNVRINGAQVPDFPRTVYKSGEVEQLDTEHATTDEQQRQGNGIAAPLMVLAFSKNTQVDLATSSGMTQAVQLLAGGVAVLTETRALAYKPSALLDRVQGVW